MAFVVRISVMKTTTRLMIGGLMIGMMLTSAAVAQDAPKPLCLHPENPHYFLFRGKPAVLIGSTEHYGAVMNLDFDYVKYLDELARHGLNETRTFSGTYREIPDSFGITDNTLSPTNYIGPWARAGDKFDLTQYDDKYFERLKDFVTQASKRGIAVEYVLFCTLYNEALWNVNPMNPKNHDAPIGAVPRREVFTLKHKELLKIQDAFVQKAVKELNAFDNVYFEICNEPYFEGVAEEWQAHIAQIIVETERELPNRHLIAQNIANDRKKVEKVTPGVSILNFHYATPPETVAMNYGLNVAIADDETGFAGKDDVYYRTEGWDFFMAGGAAYNNLDYSFTASHPAGTLTEYKSPGGGSEQLRQSLGALKKFLDGFDLVHMKPMNAAIKGGKASVAIGARKGDSARGGQMTARVLGKPGQAYAIYLRGGASAELLLDLPQGSYRAHWVNTRNGEIEKTESFEHSGGGRTLASSDYTQDIALRILRVEK
jgi:hypothetical protein